MAEENETLEGVLSFLGKNQQPYKIVRHLQASRTVREKRQLIDGNPEYAQAKSVIIVQGSVLSYEKDGVPDVFLYFHNGEKRIDFRELKRRLGIQKKTDVTFYHGALEQLLGVPEGAVSPFIRGKERIEALCFSKELIECAKAHPEMQHDISLSTVESLVANAYQLYEALRSYEATRRKVRVI